MNSPNNPFPRNEYPPEPSSARAAAEEDLEGLERRARTLKARIKRNMMLNDSVTSTASAPPLASGGGFASSFTSAASAPIETAGRDPQEVMEAASALFDLSVASPAAASFGGAAERAMALSEGTVSYGYGQRGGGDGGYPSNLSAPAAYSAAAATNSQADYLLAAARRQRYLAVVRPLPSLAGGLSGSSNGGLGGPSSLLGLPEQRVHLPTQLDRPFAGLLGSDIPLTFPQKLMELLSNPEIASIASWLPHGKGFVILQKRKFAADVMPLYFKHSKFTSFTRKLNRWGFTRVSRGPEMGAYYHKYFQRGNYLLCMQMHCQSLNKPSSASSPPAAAKDNAEGTSKEGGVEAPPSSPAADELSASSASVGAKEDSQMGDASPLPPLPPPVAATTDTAARNHEESPTIGDGIGATASSAFSTYGVFSEPEQEHKSHHGGTLARYYGHRHNHRQHRHQQEHEQRRRHQQEHHRQRREDEAKQLGFDRAFQRQQQILRGGQGHGRHRQQDDLLQRQQQHGKGFRLVQGAGEVNQFRGGSSVQHSPMLQSMQQQSPELRSCMKRSHHLQPSSSQQRPELGSPMQLSSTPHNAEFSNLGQADRVGRQHGVDTSSSRIHPLVVSDALNVLKTCSDEALLTALMNKKHNAKTKSALPHSSKQAESRLHAAMQLRQQGRESGRHHGNAVSTADDGIGGSGDRDSINIAHTLMLEKMRELQESNRKRIAKMGGNAEVLGGTGLKETHHAKVHASDPIPQRTMIAQLYNEINARNRQQQKQHGGTSDDPSNHNNNTDGQGRGDAERKYPRAVRRASAA